MRLIDADRLLQGYEDHDFIDTHVVWNAPTVDAVPVIRCKDCKHWAKGLGWCNFTDLDVEPNFYCAYAERKEA